MNPVINNGLISRAWKFKNWIYWSYFCLGTSQNFEWNEHLNDVKTPQSTVREWKSQISD